MSEGTKFFFEHEQAFDEGHNATLLNTNVAGTIFLTNIRLLFVSKATNRVVELGTIPLTAIEKLNEAPPAALKRSLPPDQSIVQVTGYDSRVIVFVFAKNNDVKKMIEGLKKCIRPVHLAHIYAFSSKRLDHEVPSSATRLLKEYHRLFHKWFSQSPSTSFKAQVDLHNNWCRISNANSGYKLCETYPTWLIVPNSISDGWDRTSQLVGLSCLLLDPFYRTFNGFQALVEKDWLAFGHKFAARMGLPTGKKRPEYKLPWHADRATRSGESSPIFLQWLECIAHLLCMYPCAFEFSSKFLADFMDAVLSCRFGNFLCNSEWEREQAEVASCPCIWTHLAELRASDTLHVHRNPLYDPQRYTGPIVPPAPALAPTLWPQFYLRWSCPLESDGCAGGFQESVKAKMGAELSGEFGRLQTNDNQPMLGRTIRVVGSNVKKV